MYFGVRVVVEGDRPTALRNAERLHDVERALGIDIELGVQELVVDRTVLRAVGNFSYVWFHWPLLITFLCLLFVRDLGRFRQLLHSLIVSGLVGLVLFATFPVAPPRFLPGYTGTVSDAARRHYLDYPLSWTNQVAAFPSFHVGWTLVACLALAATFSRPAHRVIVMVPAVLVTLAVVTTGNHYVLDSIAGTAIAVGAFVALDPERRTRATWREPAPPATSEEITDGA